MQRIGILLAILTLVCSCRTTSGIIKCSRPAVKEAGSKVYQPPFKEHLPKIPEIDIPPKTDFRPVPEELVELTLKQMSLKQKIGQRFISWIPGTEISERSKKLIQEGYLGGIILTGRNIVSRDQVKELTKALQHSAAQNSPSIRLLIGIDQEGGRVNRLDLNEVTHFSAPFYWGEYRDPLLIEAVAYIIGREALQLGCNLNFAPLLDLYDLPDASIIGDRSMGPDARQVGKHGIYYIHGAQRAGITPVIKHFPGHGMTTVDSHFKLPVVDIDEQTLIQRDLLPFRMAIENGADAVMTAHILYPQLDPVYPATLSERILKDLLRTGLGFDGVIISDDIEMKALTENFSRRDILKYSLRAGVDLILALGTSDTLEMEKMVLSLYQAGELTPAHIDEGVRRVLRLKIKYGIIPG